MIMQVRNLGREGTAQGGGQEMEGESLHRDVWDLDREDRGNNSFGWQKAEGCYSK